VTRFDAYDEPDAATVEHLYLRRHPKRGSTKKHLPSVVLACRRCNNERGVPHVEARGECPMYIRRAEETSDLRVIVEV